MALLHYASAEFSISLIIFLIRKGARPYVLINKNGNDGKARLKLPQANNAQYGSVDVPKLLFSITPLYVWILKAGRCYDHKDISFPTSKNQVQGLLIGLVRLSFGFLLFYELVL